jgi:hypothetical protein
VDIRKEDRNGRLLLGAAHDDDTVPRVGMAALDAPEWLRHHPHSVRANIVYKMSYYPTPVPGGHGSLHEFINHQRAHWRDVDPIENLIYSQTVVIGGVYDSGPVKSLFL